MQDIMGQYSGVVTPPCISTFPNPYVPKPTFVSKIPPDVYKEAFPTDQTPNQEILSNDNANKSIAAKRCLFTSQPNDNINESIPAKSCLSISQPEASTNPDQNVTTWLAGLESLYDDDQETSISSIPEEEQYGFKLPSWLSNNGPRLVKERRKASGVPLTEEEKLDIGRDNHAIVRKWLEDCNIEHSVGGGDEKLDHQAIVSQSSNNCTFSKVAEEVLEKLSPVQRYALQRYIKELKDKEKEAITTARIYRDKWEEATTSVEDGIAAARKRELSLRTYWRKNIAEQSTRGGKMVNLALRVKPPV